MEYRNLGRSGLKVSAVGLGGNNFGSSNDEASSVAVINRGLDLGINFIDTADVYGTGRSEQFIGKAVASNDFTFRVIGDPDGLGQDIQQLFQFLGALAQGFLGPCAFSDVAQNAQHLSVGHQASAYFTDKGGTIFALEMPLPGGGYGIL